MTDENKTENEPKPEQAQEAPKAEAQAREAESKIDKTIIEEITEETEKKPAAKKGKSDHEEIKPEDIKAGMVVRVHQKIIDTNAKGEEKERVQVFQGMVLARKHGGEEGATIIVRKVASGVGVEKIFPLSLPSIEKIELVRTYRVKQARPYFLRTYKKRLSEIKK
ncbi:MAG: 50S ribosomal protein L19 [Candidatus Sungbacteria bacterium]|nr:50S ribosomal protein L19 [Candidatus Sungbacteria bacterium]